MIKKRQDYKDYFRQRMEEGLTISQLMEQMTSLLPFKTTKTTSKTMGSQQKRSPMQSPMMKQNNSSDLES